MNTDAILLDEDLALSLGTRELSPPAPGEALVRVAWAGVCGSDLHVLRSGAWVTYWPATLGHEVVGVVAECPGGEVPVGTAVAVDSRLPCGQCPGCEKAPSLCHRMCWLGEVRPGGFARYLVVPATSLVLCPPELELAIAVLAEPLAITVHAVSALARPPDDALILGYGPIGALVHLELTRRWPELPVSVREPAPARLQLATALGASDPQGQPGRGGQTDDLRSYDLVVDAAGYPRSLADACSYTANGGTVLVVALSHGTVAVAPAELVERSLTITGSVGFDHELAGALALLAAAPDRYRPLVTEAVLLEEATQRLPGLAASPATGKLVLRPWQE
jgi:2-desacetyl-2-hydroxyethyl bacteriochlorophyllide A dehydrogenase